MCVLQKFALMLIVIGAVNGGLIGLFQYVLDVAIFGGQHTGLSRIIYSIGGIAGLLSFSLFFHLKVYPVLKWDIRANNYVSLYRY
ncbi:DUF378 domain-containing protein [Bacillus circulans]|uniref:DUF378 domain-containing protein n=1 Tax=Niallia circulans TaxID=1397 RepID=UPI001490723D|nr:DUF378 domain-containing protein [Niallia circulans]NRG29095.1 DUF378 domain-containing protein [Niallia circulans]QJX62578.1 DUF378 domain-containing protein [Niallia circulans]